MLLTLFALIGYSDFVRGLSPDARSQVTSWAPRVWLHPEEVFYPSTVQHHLDNVENRNKEEAVVQSSPIPQESLLGGEPTADWHLNTQNDLECVNCFEDFFSGQPADQVPSYAFVTEHNDSCSTVDVTYTLFYPFNYGKDVCIGLEVGGSCVGDLRTFGNHVGDWEHVSLRLQGGRPTLIYVGVHSFGAWYEWDDGAGKFNFQRGEPLFHKEIRKRRSLQVSSSGVRMDVDYPKELFLEDGHPTVFSANGSHGVWAQEGKHTYLHILTVHLDDMCAKGQAWDTWNNLEIIETRDEADSYEGAQTWVDFRGRWGNAKKMSCEFEPIVGECGVTGGPTGPRKYFQHNFEQPPQCV